MQVYLTEWLLCFSCQFTNNSEEFLRKIPLDNKLVIPKKQNTNDYIQKSNLKTTGIYVQHIKTQ